MDRFMGVKQILEKGHSMKKLLPALACVVALMLAMPTLAFAGHGGSHHGWRNNGNGQGSVQSCPLGQQGNCGRGYVDADNDGVCDNQGQCARFVDTDNDGICDNFAARDMTCWQCIDADGDGFCEQHHGACFYDADGDGVCDHRQGKYFIDEDGDGICDHQAAHACVDEDNDGVCDFAQNGVCPVAGEGCSRFIDEDGDGVCDYHHSGVHCNNYQAPSSDDTSSTSSANAGTLQRQGLGQHHRSGHGCRW